MRWPEEGAAASTALLVCSSNGGGVSESWYEIVGRRDSYDFEFEDVGIAEGPSASLPASLPGLPAEDAEDE